MNNYTKQWSTATPGYIIFLVDQSQSMATQWPDGKKFSVYTASVINQTINELIATNAAGETVKDRIFISLIGYGGSGGNSVENLRSDYLSKYADKPDRIEKSQKKVPDGAGGFVTMEIELPIFLDPVAVGYTPMARAFDFAKQTIESWILKKSDNPAPVIINISDGAPYDGIGSEAEIAKTVVIANSIMNLQTQDGPPLIFNVHISEKGNEIQFPENEGDLKGNSMAEFLFKISSRIPEVYKKAAKNLDLQVKVNSKGFISNASPDSLVKFINFGSSGGSDRTNV